MDWSKVKRDDSIQEILRKVVTPEEWELIRQNYLKGMQKKQERLAKQRIRSRKWREKKKAEMEAMQHEQGSKAESTE